MSNQVSNINNKKYDLEERTALFGEAVIRFSATIPKTTITTPLIN